MSLRIPARLVHLASLLIPFAPFACASVGDRSPAYRSCVSTCTSGRCEATQSSDSDAASFRAYSPSPLWSCTSTCAYACRQRLTALALSPNPRPDDLEGLPIGRQVQFHGKWPFHRLDLSALPFPLWLVDLFVPRAQEPLSVLFSIGNLYAHYRGFVALRALSRTGSRGARTVEGRRLAKAYLVYAWSGLNAWTWSIVFHTRDVDWTERADYFGAGATTLAGLWMCIVRLRGWYASPATAEARRFKPVVTYGLALVYVLHVLYLGLRERFDYAYNMKFNIAFSLSTIALWLFWCFRQSTLPSPSNFSRRQLSAYPSARSRFRAPHHLDPVAPLLLLPSLTALEVLDFAPFGPFGLRLVDAHALWHLSTIPVVVLWYNFLVRDVRWLDGQGDPPTAANAVPGAGNGADVTPSTTRALLGSAFSTPLFGRSPSISQGRSGPGEGRRGTIKEGMVGYGLGVLDKYGLGLGKKGRAAGIQRNAHTSGGGTGVPAGGGAGGPGSNGEKKR
ncbi:hypothetical protein JCM10212_000908 [Sporobolomyces blumeae]